MKRKMIGYWICTVVIALCIGSGGAAQVLRVPQNVEGLTALGYPLHFIVLLGVWKVLGALTLLAPGLRLVKEWAYAGIFIDLSGAVVASAANGGAAFHVIAPIVLIGILAASWALRPESRRLPDAKEGSATPNPASGAPLLHVPAGRGTAQEGRAGAT
jgi:DoxX-like family